MVVGYTDVEEEEETFVPHDEVLKIKTIAQYIELMSEQSRLLKPGKLEERSYQYLVGIGVLSPGMKNGFLSKKGGLG